MPEATRLNCEQSEVIVIVNREGREGQRLQLLVNRWPNCESDVIRTWVRVRTDCRNGAV